MLLLQLIKATLQKHFRCYPAALQLKNIYSAIKNAKPIQLIVTVSLGCFTVVFNILPFAKCPFLSSLSSGFCT
jgi:hypothetical protein